MGSKRLNVRLAMWCFRKTSNGDSDRKFESRHVDLKIPPVFLERLASIRKENHPPGR